MLVSSIFGRLLLFFTIILFKCRHGNCSDTPKIAIIGGGVGGTVAAYHLHDLFGPSTEIDVFEPRSVGGRVKNVEIGGRQYEAGASIMHTSNLYMVNYTKMLGLKVRDKAHTRLSIYDGTDLRFIGSDWQVVTLTKIIWRYGLDMYRLNSVITDIISKFSRIYTHQKNGEAFSTVERLLSSMHKDFPALCGTTLRQVLQSHGISDVFIDEFAESGLNVNYGQTADVHAFVGLIGMAGTLPGLWSVHGGNYLVSKGLMRESRANAIPAEVISVTRNIDNKRTSYDVKFMYADGDRDPVTVTLNYDLVVIATPLHEGVSDILFLQFAAPVRYSEGEFHRTLATFVQGAPNASYFGEASPDIHTVLVSDATAPINCFARNLPVDWSVREGTALPQPVYKIFSKTPLDDGLLREMFTSISDVEAIDWLAYPHYDTRGDLPSFILDENLYYINGIELAASAMEMSAIGARNVALLAYNRWRGLEEKIDGVAQTMDERTNEL